MEDIFFRFPKTDQVIMLNHISKHYYILKPDTIGKPCFSLIHSRNQNSELNSSLKPTLSGHKWSLSSPTTSTCGLSYHCPDFSKVEETLCPPPACYYRQNLKNWLYLGRFLMLFPKINTNTIWFFPNVFKKWEKEWNLPTLSLQNEDFLVNWHGSLPYYVLAKKCSDECVNELNYGHYPPPIPTSINHLSNIHLKCIQFLFGNYTSIKLCCNLNIPQGPSCERLGPLGGTIRRCWSG
jgi:hypothetical protein